MILDYYILQLMTSLSVIACRDLALLHASFNVNFCIIGQRKPHANAGGVVQIPRKERKPPRQRHPKILEDEAAALVYIRREII
jgi:hypothetical protein